MPDVRGPMGPSGGLPPQAGFRGPSGADEFSLWFSQRYGWGKTPPPPGSPERESLMQEFYMYQQQQQEAEMLKKLLAERGAVGSSSGGGSDGGQPRWVESIWDKFKGPNYKQGGTNTSSLWNW